MPIVTFVLSTKISVLSNWISEQGVSDPRLELRLILQVQVIWIVAITPITELFRALTLAVVFLTFLAK